MCKKHVEVKMSEINDFYGTKYPDDFPGKHKAWCELQDKLSKDYESGYHKDGAYLQYCWEPDNSYQVKLCYHPKTCWLSASSDNIIGCRETYFSNDVCFSTACSRCGFVNSSVSVFESYSVYGASYCWYIENACGCANVTFGHDLFGVVNSKFVSNCLFCYGIDNSHYMLFNKPVSKIKFNKVYNKLKEFKWFPKFTNGDQLYFEDYWDENTQNISISAWEYVRKFREIDNKTAWEKMPQELKQYIQSLPEYDEIIFNKITGEVKSIDRKTLLGYIGY